MPGLGLSLRLLEAMQLVDGFAVLPFGLVEASDAFKRGRLVADGLGFAESVARPLEDGRCALDSFQGLARLAGLQEHNAQVVRGLGRLESVTSPTEFLHRRAQSLGGLGPSALTVRGQPQPLRFAGIRGPRSHRVISSRPSPTVRSFSTESPLRRRAMRR